jgi:hypothetical protein
LARRTAPTFPTCFDLECPLLALSGHPIGNVECPLSGVKQTWPIAVLECAPAKGF